MKEWKLYQQIYNALVVEHSDALEIQVVVESDEIIDNAINFFLERLDYCVYPAKSYATAIIYALMLEETYGEDIKETLNDAELFLGQDKYFVPYDEDPSTYDALLKKVLELRNWKDGGWVPYTINYFNLECTEAGAESINNANPVVTLPE